MRRFRRRTRICILSLLVFSVVVPIFLLSGRLKHLNFDSSREFTEDLTSIKHRTEAMELNSNEQEEGGDVREPALLVYKDVNFTENDSVDSSDYDIKPEELGIGESSVDLPKKHETNNDTREDNQKPQEDRVLLTSGRKEEIGHNAKQHGQDAHPRARRILDEKIKEMKDQMIRAKAYLNFAETDKNSHLVKELRLRLREMERTLGEAPKGSDISRRSLQRMKAMEMSLSKASRIYPDCSTMVKKLRAMTHSAEEQVRAQRSEEEFLVLLAGRTTPKGLHCLSLRLTAEYFALQPEEREILTRREIYDPDLFHFAFISDNILACAAVVDSIISTSLEPARVVIHVVTDSLNFATMSMWFLLNPPGKAAIQIQSMDSFDWLSSKYEAVGNENVGSRDARYSSPLNHLRFYLPDIFPKLNKIVFLDHDVIVQRDLAGLWRVDMRGKVNAAVETCHGDNNLFHRMDMLLNFSDPMVENSFDVEACTWAFGMNVFDLQKWRMLDLTGLYHKYLLLGKKRPLWKAGTLPLGWVTFYNQTTPLDRRYHVLGLGSHSSISEQEVEQAALIHYSGIMKPWLDIGLEKYRKYWTKHVNIDHPYLQQCNIHY